MKSPGSIFRKLNKNKTTTSLGVAGLVAGLMCVVYIFLLVTDELSFDRFNKKLDRIFVVHAYLEEGNGKHDFSGCPPAVATALKDEYPEVETTCRYIPPYFEYLIVSGENRYTEKTAYADFSIFDIFSFPFIYGNKGEVNTPNRIIMTQKVAQKYFGKTNPVGKIVRMDNRLDMTVAGVIKDFPSNSSINFDAIVPVELIKYYFSRDDFLTSWYNNAFNTYGLLVRPQGYEKVVSAITKRIQKEIPESTNFLRAYKFKDHHLYEQKNIRIVRIFILIALIVLIAAMLNFINLNTARSSKQARETGLRKTFGATRLNVKRLIYSDVAFTCLIAFILAILIDYIGLPLINRLVGKEISFAVLFSPAPLIAMVSLYFLTIALSGSYPAFFLSSFTPGQILSSNFQTVKSRGNFRNAFITVMYIVSVSLLATTLVISKQTDFMQKMDIGFDKDQIMFVTLKGKLREQVEALKQEIGRFPGVISSCLVAHLPDQIGNNGEGWTWEGKDPNFKPLVTTWETDEDLVKTFNAKMVEGDFFSKDREGIVINKTFADMIGWNSFAGKTITNGEQYRIVGVIKDIRFNSISALTMPMAIQRIGNSIFSYLTIKVNHEDIGNTISFITKTCETMEPSFPVEFGFLKERYDRMLTSEINLKKLVSVFSVFSIIVLCLGMFGTVMFLIEQKTKVIGIRKCMGEKVLSIIGQLTRPFIVTRIIAGVIAVPLTWYIMKHWLQNYAYHIDLTLWIFLTSCLITLGIAVLTVFWQSWRAATRNPVEALRYE